jgi:twitching motility protein PilU
MILGDLIMEKRGLLLMVGATGAGKSTTLASMMDYRNEQVSGHILTIEDPVEFLFTATRSPCSTSARWAATPNRCRRH